MTDNENGDVMRDIALKAKSMAQKLANLDTETKNKLLLHIRDNIQKNRDRISAANALDMTAARQMVDAGTLTPPLLNRLDLSAVKIDQLSTYLEQVAKLDDPVGKKQFAMKLAEDLELTRVSCPIGVVSIIFESRPEVVIQVTALSLKSGNVVILKGGTEAGNSNRILFELIEQVLETYHLKGAVNLIETRADVANLLHLDDQIDLIIPRGSNEFVRYIQDNTKIPVLGHSSGICHLYLDKTCDPQKAIAVTLDSKLDYPSACNAVETLLVHEETVEAVLPELLAELKKADVRLLG
ncbi:MAG: glutamate-5-semialdehyde dehydrogenase, partial [Deltaproteobacteria bacterium]|nr:glutamate-5-semialdehyde dehydrogenase [Deltaproteobacteria bacterium]